MSTHTARQTAIAEPSHVLQVLTDPAACRLASLAVALDNDLGPGATLPMKELTNAVTV